MSVSVRCCFPLPTCSNDFNKRSNRSHKLSSLFFFFIPKVIYRALPPWRKVDPYGPAAQHQLMITNLRVRLLQRQPCPCQAKDLEAAILPTDHYAIYDFIVKGSCLCNGHADHCVPSRGFRAGQQKTSNMVRDFHYRAGPAAAP